MPRRKLRSSDLAPVVPHAERSAAAGSQHPGGLFDRSLRSSKVQEHECRDDRVERLILERQCSRVPMHELDAHYVGAGIGEHRVGEVDANRLRTALGRSRGDIAGARRDIEETCPSAGAHRIQERLCDLRCHAPQEPVVGGSLLRRPAGFLERIERGGVVLGHNLKYGNGDATLFGERRVTVLFRCDPGRSEVVGAEESSAAMRGN
jgi:hypothetical protein